ncbi:damage-inducible protein [Rhodanobacter sp. C06]|uniref:DEAD/DEAH box helicase n=1 Tax=Rhodanobacter sp. C06 TaxID=1945854 RepID=UPI000985B4F4|nr:type ISP restriction/modification enzyme [Rhodanobacter sp. C06]OOG49283.1 damage-inducible protein [Rhodanobacter sp. C06]
MSALHDLLSTFRQAAVTEREKGTYFEELTLAYLRNEASYRDLYSQVWTYADWAKSQGLDGRDTGIDLVAEVAGTGELHAIQCKLYAEDYKLQRKDIDSFFTASGKKPFVHRIIVTTTSRWSEHAEDALRDQQPPVTKIDLHDLETSQIDWARYKPHAAPVLKPHKSPRPHQLSALAAVRAGLSDAERGKLIMACGTGKTYTALKIAEDLAGRGRRILFLVPSLSLLSQTLTEWTQESTTPLHSFAVCSDADVGKKRKADDDAVQTFTHELRYPATTDAKRLALEMTKRHDAAHMDVVFATYHSIDVVSRTQREYSLPAFDLVICDEAHRTTGATFEGEDESHFVQVHDADFIKASKRLYMTATPRIYGEAAKASAQQDKVALASMDDEALFGKPLYVLTFSEAVKRDLLVDYKVIVLAVEEAHINRRLQHLLKDDDNSLKMDDAARIVGCWKALSKQGLTEDLADDGHAMQRAVAFCQVIEAKPGAKVRKVGSKNIRDMFQAVVEEYQRTAESEEEASATLRCEAEHIDGGMNASEKEEKLDWLKATPPENTCRVLSNVRCLSEGVDVPALDAVLFLTPRNSQVDVVQSVGRVMRKAPGKTRGYIVLPVVIPAGVEPHKALDDNSTYKVVWQVLQALRSHDDRFDAMVNKLDLIGKDTSKMEVVAVTDKVLRRAANLKVSKTTQHANLARGGGAIGRAVAEPRPEQAEMAFEIGEIERAIYAKLVQKVGNRHHWEDWAGDIAKIANTHIDRIHAILEDPVHANEREVFGEFAAELRDDLNDGISDDEIIEMLAQHLITKPVFDALFEGYSFASHNPMSLAMQKVLDALEEHRLDKEADTLTQFYDSVKLRAQGIDSAAAKQKIVVELYDKFFRNAFPRMTERLGIVYTPVEVVDFIIHSVEHILRNEFGEGLGSKNVHILDPFTGTGTFITRLMQSGLISPAQLPHKYRHEIHANELVLLAYYIAAINIESTYHDIVGGDYVPFEGICLTDTFQMYEKDDLVDALLVDNSARRKRQKTLDIRVILGNPPYSAGQKSENDNADNLAYPHLDARIRSTYAAWSKATLAKGLYDSYIRAIRWASDRLGNSGVIGFVTNAGWLDANTADGLRLCLAEEFSSVHVFHLRGNARTSGEQRRKEKDNVFGMGSRAPIAISLLVKNPHAKERGRIHFHDIGDYLSREDKLAKVAAFGSIAGISEANAWESITPDQHGDWLRQRDDSFGQFIPLGDKRGNGLKLFDNFSQGVLTARDAWCYSASKDAVETNMERMVSFYNDEVARFDRACIGLDRKTREKRVDDLVDNDASRISWTANIKQELIKGRTFDFESKGVVRSLYRPFTKQWVYFNRSFNERVYQMPRIFPDVEMGNRVICALGAGSRKDFSVLMADAIPNFDSMEKGQCFPEHLYETGAAAAIAASSEQRAASSEQRAASSEQRAASSEYTVWQPDRSESHDQPGDLSNPEWNEGLLGVDDRYVAGQPSDRRFPVLPDVSLRSRGDRAMSAATQTTSDDLFQQEREQRKIVRRDGITDAGLAHFQAAYLGETISKEDIFYYVYGLLHSPDYRERYADNLAKELPRIPCAKTAADFWAFSKAGRALADLHLNYETVPMYASAKIETGGRKLADADYRVEKMKVPKTGGVKDLTRLIYNAHITITNIPPEAYDYVVNGKPALDWVIERQCVKTDKDSGIVNDANDWAIETMGNPRYPLELFLRVVTVSLETMKVVRGLPKLDI